MKTFFRHTERGFEKFTNFATAVLSNSITFFVVVCLIAFWLTNEQLFGHDIHARIGDIILGVTFLYLFIIQKSFNHFSASLHMKVNELVSSHTAASNAVLSAEEKTEEEITELSKEYIELAKKTMEDEETLEKLQTKIEMVSKTDSDSKLSH